jgi:hypothetical protein
MSEPEYLASRAKAVIHGTGEEMGISCTRRGTRGPLGDEHYVVSTIGRERRRPVGTL